MKKIVLISWIIFLIAALPVRSIAKIYIDIDSPNIPKFPIAITDFVNQGARSDPEALSQWFSGQISQILTMTGYFDVINKAAYLEPPEKKALLTADIRFADWSSIGAESLVKGAFQYNGNALTGEFMLYDVVMGKLIIGKKYVGSLQDRREMVTRFSNEILLALTGQRGIFDTRIAFVGKKGKTWDLYTVDFTGSVLTKLTDIKALTLLPQWSPDGKTIAFTSYRNGNPDLYLINSEGGQEKRITAYRGLTLAGPWSSDGKSILITSSKDGKEEIYSFDFKDNRMKCLTHDAAINVSPSRSPDAGKIVFTSDRGGSPQIYIMDSDGSNVKRLTFEGNYNTSPRWSPTAARIAYESLRNGTFQIVTMEISGNNSLQLTFQGRNESPSWSPDGKNIVFVSTQNGKPKLCIISANGGNLRILHEGMDQYLNPCWSPRLNFN